MNFTVFTPTYNRAYILPQLYNSLINQTNQNFKWLVIDDGSTDDTENLIESFIVENKISIKYIKQENQGKHIGINNSFNHINTEYFIIIDSDDYLLNNAIEECNTILKEIKNKKNVAGFTFFNYLDVNEVPIENYGKIKTLDYNKIKFNIKGESNFVLKADIAKKYKFPVFKDENFCQEAYMLVKIMDNHQILFTDYILARGEYLEDGLSQNIYKRLLQNPKYSLATLKIKYKSNLFTREQKQQFAINYWDIAIKSKKICVLKQLFNFPIKGILTYIKFRFMNKR